MLSMNKIKGFVAFFAYFACIFLLRAPNNEWSFSLKYQQIHALP